MSYSLRFLLRFLQYLFSQCLSVNIKSVSYTHLAIPACNEKRWRFSSQLQSCHPSSEAGFEDTMFSSFGMLKSIDGNHPRPSFQIHLREWLTVTPKWVESQNGLLIGERPSSNPAVSSMKKWIRLSRGFCSTVIRWVTAVSHRCV